MVEKHLEKKRWGGWLVSILSCPGSGEEEGLHRQDAGDASIDALVLD